MGSATSEACLPLPGVLAGCCASWNCQCRFFCGHTQRCLSLCCKHPDPSTHSCRCGTCCRVDIASGAVELAADVAAANHSRALFNMMLALMVILLLMLFVVTLNYTIWKVGGQATVPGGLAAAAFFSRAEGLGRAEEGTRVACRLCMGALSEPVHSCGAHACPPAHLPCPSPACPPACPADAG